MDWQYDTAFSRDIGLVTPDEQQRLRRSRVAIAGMGGVGGVNAVTLARMGVGSFMLADYDEFEVANTNRQYGAMFSTMGQSKVYVMDRIIRDINPEANVYVYAEPIGKSNVAPFLRGADIFVDSMDAFSVAARRAVFAEARRQRMPCIGAGPVGLTVVWTIFDTMGMSFDEYFDLSDDQSTIEQFAGYVVGQAPGAHELYNVGKIDMDSGSGPSLACTCQLCGAIVGAEVLKILLGRDPIYPVPYYHELRMDTYQYTRGCLLHGNHSPKQRERRQRLIDALGGNNVGTSGLAL